MIGNIGETVYNALKILAVIAICATFMVAINILLRLLVTYVVPDVVTEFFDLISMYLPFNANAVFGSITTVISGILAFKVARKIFDLSSWGVSSA